MDINNLTIGQTKELASLFQSTSNDKPSLHKMIGDYVIIMTYSAGVWCGFLSEKTGNEVISREARRMYKWWAAESIRLSAVAIYGIKQDKSKIIEPVESVLLEAIEIIPCTKIAKTSLSGAPNVAAS